MNYCYDCRATFELDPNDDGYCKNCFSENYEPVTEVRKNYADKMNTASVGVVTLSGAIVAIEKQKDELANKVIEYTQILERLRK